MEPTAAHPICRRRAGRAEWALLGLTIWLMTGYPRARSAAQSIVELAL